jgi:beta-glucosidase
MACKTYSVRILLLTVASVWPCSLLRAQSPPRLDDAAIEQRVSRLLGQMTLEEKIGQIVPFADRSTGPGSAHADYREQTAEGRVGSFENITGADETNSLQKLAVENSRRECRFRHCQVASF